MVDCGGYYLGHPGHLLRIDGSHGGLVRDWQDTITVHRDGLNPTYAFASPRRGGRVWSFTLDNALVDEISPLHELITATPAPLMMVEPWAQVTNVLPPEASMFIGSAVFGDPLQVGGGYDIAGGGHVARHAINPSAQSGAEALVQAGVAPVRPGSTVTASTYVASRYGATVGIAWYGSSGSMLSHSATSAPAPADVSRLHRVSVTHTAPAAAVGAGVLVRRGEYMARAALTWTDHLTEWGIGGLAKQCVILGVSDRVDMAVPGAGNASLRRTATSFTVEEIAV